MVYLENPLGPTLRTRWKSPIAVLVHSIRPPLTLIG